MVIRPALPNGYSLVQPLKTSAPRRMSGASIAVLAAVAATHVGLALYLYGQHFTPSRLPARPDPAPIIIEIPRWKTEPPPTDTRRRLPSRPVDVHRDQPVILKQTQTVDLQPQPKPQGPVDLSKPQDLSAPTSEPPPQPPRPHTISDPHWLSRPTADDLAGAYPERALADGKSGFARLSCTVAASGVLASCAVAEETPRGWGFGAAALSLAKRFRIGPRTEDGQPVDGGMIEIPIRFAYQAG